MNPKNRRKELYLDDILTSMNRIQEYVNGFNFMDFKSNNLVVDGVIRNFEIIGEAAKNLPNELKAAHPELPWDKMYGLRNLVSHAYFGIDYEMIWKIIKEELPKNKRDLVRVIEKEK